MIKNELYQIYKISSTRFDRCNYNLTLSYEQAIINQEVVSLSSSQLLRKMRKVCGYSQKETFIKEYIAVKIDKKCHYKRIKKNNGVIVN